MSYDFNADEVFEMAEQIERNGAKFYRDAAENATASPSKDLLRSLSKMEEAHEKTFKAMPRSLTRRAKHLFIFKPLRTPGFFLKKKSTPPLCWRSSKPQSKLKKTPSCFIWA
jgi:rubrerythrin